MILKRNKYCICGCGKKLKMPNSIYAQGHYWKGKIHSEEDRKRMSERQKGRSGTYGMLGKRHTIETKIKMSETAKNRSEETRIKNSESHKGKTLSEETKKKISKINTGRILSPGIRKRMSESHKGKPLSKEHRKNLTKANKKRIGTRHTEETKRKMSKKHKELWACAEFVEAWVKGSKIKPNKPEKKLNNILQKLFPKEYKLNVKANVMILGRKVPDFVNVNGKKKLVELWGNYWHRGQDPNNRINYFKQFGWNTLVVWERELKKENLLKVRLLNFHNLGIDSRLKRTKNDFI